MRNLLLLLIPLLLTSPSILKFVSCSSPQQPPPPPSPPSSSPPQFSSVIKSKFFSSTPTPAFHITGPFGLSLSGSAYVTIEGISSDKEHQGGLGVGVYRFNNYNDFLNIFTSYLDGSQCDDVKASLRSREGAGLLNENAANATIRGETIQYKVRNKDERGSYYLIAYSCGASKSNPSADAPSRISEISVSYAFVNVNSRGEVSYISRGLSPLPTMYLIFFILYLICIRCWHSTVKSFRGGYRPIHVAMLLLLTLKCVTMLTLSLKYRSISRSNQSPFWGPIDLTIESFKSIGNFLVLILLGTGWSVLTPTLSPRSKKLATIIITIQIVSSILSFSLSSDAYGTSEYVAVSTALRLLDVLCCVIVLTPIVWKIRDLESTTSSSSSSAAGVGSSSYEDDINSSSDDDDDDTTQIKRSRSLKKFRLFYIAIVSYIYLTRILLYIIKNSLTYNHEWFEELLYEVFTLAVYGVAGWMARGEREKGGYRAVSKDVGVEMGGV